MKVNIDYKRKFFHEYLIYRAIERVNELRAIKSKNPITITQSNGLHDIISDAIKGEGLKLSTSTSKNFAKVMDEVLVDKLELESGSVFNSEFNLQSVFKEFMDITKFNKDEVETTAGFIPISPYDPNFRHRETFMESGKLGAIGSATVTTPVDFMSVDSSLGQNIHYMVDLDAYLNRRNDSYQPETRPIATKLDVTGISKLRPFMTEKEWKETAEWGSNIDTSTASLTNARRNAIDSAIHILNGLDEMGYDYNISRGNKPGRISAKVVGTSIDIRLADTPEDSSYIGGVYDSGQRISFTSSRVTNVDGAIKTASYDNPTPEDSLNLVKYALGEEIVHEGELVGGPINTKITKSGRMTAKYKTINNGRETISIAFDTSKRNSQSKYLADSDHAFDYIEERAKFANERVQGELENILNSREKFDNDLFNGVVMDGETADSIDYIISEDTEISNIQDLYIKALDGDTTSINIIETELVDSDVTLPDFEELERKYESAIEGIDESVDASSLTMESLYAHDLVRQHIVNTRAKLIGDIALSDEDLELVGKSRVGTLNPLGVCKYINKGQSVHREQSDLAKALKMLDFDKENLLGDSTLHDDFVNRLVKFDETTARPMKSADNSEFMNTMYDTISNALRVNGVDVLSEDLIRIDDNGVISYSGILSNGDKTPVNGTIGQIFDIDNDGVVVTKFNSDNNYETVPGYEAHIVRQKVGEDKNFVERTRLKSYTNSMMKSINYNIKIQAALAGKTAKNNDGVIVRDASSDLNGVYKNIYAERHALGFREEAIKSGMPEDVLKDIIATEASRLRYGNEIAQGSTVHSEYMFNLHGGDLRNDTYKDPYTLTGGTNVAVLDAQADGYFDPLITSATSSIQGSVRYLVSKAHVNPDGTITPTDDMEDRAPIMLNEITEDMKYDPFDRQAMTISNIMQSVSVSKPAKIAQMTFGGWNQDDPIVVSKAYAEANTMTNHDGEQRPLIVGDKLSDFHGNKGVVSLVIDPEMSLEEARERGIEKQVAWFKSNPDLDMIMAPFPAVSRFNGGSAREMMRDVGDLIDPETGDVIKGATGTARIIITDKAADIKTHVYDEAEVRAGNGRKFSSQLSWVFATKGAKEIMKEAFGHNDGAVSKLREYLISVGLDVDEYGNLQTEYTPHNGEERRRFTLPDIENIPLNKSVKGRTSDISKIVNKREVTKLANQMLEGGGGFLELPFAMEYPTGDLTKVNPETGKYEMPILSSYLRSGQTFEDGGVRAHDYTQHYSSIYESALTYMALENLIKTNDFPAERNEIIMREMEAQRESAQSKFSLITNDVKSRAFESKHNVFRDDVMSKRMSNSATSIWSADPRLDLNEVGMSATMAESLGLKDGDGTLIWRDPILRDSGIRYMKVKIDPEITGVAITPAMAKCFDGDFDGDSVGIVALSGIESNIEAQRLYSVEENLLDLGTYDQSLEAEGMPYDFNISTGLDVQVAIHENPELADRFKELRIRANEAYNMEDRDEASVINNQIVSELNEVYHEAYDKVVGSAIIKFDSLENHLESVNEACIETGAKGSPGKMKDYMRWVGGEFKDDSKYDFSADNIIDKKEPQITRDMHQGTMYATAVKTFGTGVAGSFSQRAIQSLRNECPDAVTELTYPVTQTILQSKHDPVAAEHNYAVVMGPARDLWKGRSIKNEDGTYKVNYDNGKPIQATKEEWVDSFKEIYTSDSGMGVDLNVNYLNRVADIMVDSETGVMRSIEDIAPETGSVMDNLAYSKSFDTLIEYAKDNADLFSGVNNKGFMPQNVSRNRYLKEHGREVEAKLIAKGDVKARDGQLNNISDIANHNITTEARRTIDTYFSQKTEQTESSIDTAKYASLMNELKNNGHDVLIRPTYSEADIVEVINAELVLAKSKGEEAIVKHNAKIALVIEAGVITDDISKARLDEVYEASGGVLESEAENAFETESEIKESQRNDTVIQSTIESETVTTKEDDYDCEF